MNLRSAIEEKLTLSILSLLFVGFLAGVGTLEYIYSHSSRYVDADAHAAIRKEHEDLEARFEALRKEHDALTIQNTDRICDIELDFFLHKHIEHVRPRLLTYGAFIDLMKENSATQLSDPQCFIDRNGQAVIRYNATGGPRGNMDENMDWVVDSRSESVVPSSPFAKAMYRTIGTLK